MIILLKRAYDAVLENYDVIVMPTLPYKAPKLPTKSWSMMGKFRHTFSIIVPFIDIPMFNVRISECTTCKCMLDAISKFLYCLVSGHR